MSMLKVCVLFAAQLLPAVLTIRDSESVALETDHVKVAPSNDADEVSATLGRFAYLKHGFDAGGCSVEGHWDDGKTPAVTFHSKPSETTHGTQDMMLAIKGLPSLLIQMDTKLNEMSSLELGGIPVRSQSEVSSSDALRNGFNSIFNSSFALHGAKRMSSLLATKNLDGSKHACANRLHSLLLLLANGANKKVAASPGLQSVSILEKGQQAVMGQGKQSADQAGPLLLGDVAGPYGISYKTCPKEGETTWECRVEHSVTRSAQTEWCVPGTPGCDLNGTWSFWKGPRDVTCQPRSGYTTKGQSECRGLCGALCDCWEGICGPEYNCAYLQICCAHDQACSTHFDDFADVRACISTTAICKACGGGFACEWASNLLRVAGHIVTGGQHLGGGD